MPGRHLNPDFSDRAFLRKELPWEALAVFSEQDPSRNDFEILENRWRIYESLRSSIWDAVEHGTEALVDDYLLTLQFMQAALMRQATRYLSVYEQRRMAASPLEKTDAVV